MDNVETASLVGMRIDFKSSWPLVSAVLAQMAHLVANITFASTSIGSTSFLPSVLAIVVAIVGVAVVVVAAGAVVESSFVVKLSFVVTRYLHWSWAYAFHQDKASSVKVPVANVTLFSSAHLLRENTDSFHVCYYGVPVGPSSCWIPALAIVAAELLERGGTIRTSFLMHLES
ncbi:hypothetical protein Tco_1173742 [Tanacetum coccineum]